MRDIQLWGLDVTGVRAGRQPKDRDKHNSKVNSWSRRGQSNERIFFFEAAKSLHDRE